MNNRCETCNNELSQCGPPNVDGEPTEDCLVCKLREERKVFNQVMAEALEEAFVEGWERCDLSGEITTKYQWMSSAAKKLADNLMKGT